MKRDEGFVLLSVAVLATLALAVWAVAYRATMDAIRAEAEVVRRATRDDSVLPALAAGVALLETGLPSSNPYACIVTARGHRCVVTFRRNGGDWIVTAEPATETDLRSLPRAPRRFGA